MKTLSLVALLLLLAGITFAQGPDAPIWLYSGDQERGGILSPGQGDEVSGQALCWSGGLAPFGWRIGGILSIVNDQPQPACGGLSYSIESQQVSYRPDNMMDHVHQYGVSWSVNGGTPAIYSAYESCSVTGTVPPYQIGDPYVIVNRSGTCP